ncbi:hypothetical protein M406DRAFT_325168 [Cryphonectria parasitica EP155]|uniref:RNase MRP protein 1 RNA binding domain-containing protein n=1 Tax=Cryphonectria parasitica (strain ATCC 38755 / EP155) TaxID=660469 RepID=A0A9P4Y9W8_CRYP1|nr:uncharacterized protein M406DRAFT_325168 [Cryphonectria parasitica EP155]KAF3769674.1 hypothetical protein M406DRAFT_325168 [Cryphonectria parasitica EP155]
MSSPGPNPYPSPTQLKPTLTSLATAAHILDGFAHRNKNQHRATAWWPAFNMLRRNLHKLTSDLEDAVQQAEFLLSSSSSSFSLAPSSSNNKKKRQKGLVVPPPPLAAAVAARQPALDRVVERAVWVRDVLVTRCYGAFTQLTADRQFAQLGLLLLGVLAQIQAAIQLFIPPPKQEEEETRATEEPARPAAVIAHGSAEGIGTSGGSDQLDLGVAVSRDEMSGGGGGGRDDDVDSHDTRQDIEQRSSPVPRQPLMDEVSEAGRGGGKSRKQKRSRIDDGSARTNREGREPPRRTQSPPAVVEAMEVKKAQKKRKKKGGDEFDDLFSSLM